MLPSADSATFEHARQKTLCCLDMRQPEFVGNTELKMQELDEQGSEQEEEPLGRRNV